MYRFSPSLSVPLSLFLSFYLALLQKPFQTISNILHAE